ncbi:DUF4349 domain-containing protein [Nocardioides zhouii]|uniref:DUF4349 domain-containing protein n=1 Tax=Nocardioides zhouii TaxID=1168729 RepID=A0A4Q2T140_9ACTN|nr:DUF4349 domain-containing protein [Nocardioides zhouii]RYC10418.1 DUF4349 domain-containing protein [Nocardioides zhouii]
MTTRTRAAGVLTAFTMTVFLAACSSGASDGGGDASSEAMNDLSAGDSGGATSREFAAAEDATSSLSESGSGSAPASGSGAKVATTPQMERAVIFSGTVSLSSKDVTETRQEVQRIVDAQGGDVTEENTETDEDGDTSYSRFVIRVPSAKFSAAMSALEAVDGVVASNRGSEDVTTQVIDNDVRVRAQEASLKRVELLLAEATSLKNLIWIESQLTTRQAELDSLKSQQSWLTDQTSLSTITVDISAKHTKAVEKKKDDPAGFLTGLSGGMKALSGTLLALATVLGALLPFAVLALVIGLPAWLVVRRRRATPAQAETPTA